MISIMTIFIIISTHDLARRSTKNPNEQPQNQRNFNSRPRKEVDPCILFLIKRICHFNSRPRKEVDIEWRKGTGNTDISTHDLARRSTAWEFILCKRIGISTHDLARRSTCPSLRPRSSSILFQLTTSQGGRLLDTLFIVMFAGTFQLTTSQGGRRTEAERVLAVHDFNSRPRKEVDAEDREADIPDLISTHDLARRSTYFFYNNTTQKIFQLTTSQGGRQQFLRKKFSFQNHFLCSLHIIYSYYINIVFFSTLFLAKSSFFLVRIP